MKGKEKMIFVNSISITLKNSKIKVGEWCHEISACVFPANATCKSVRWESSDTSIISINQTLGYMYAHKEGSVTISAHAVDGSGVFGCCRVTSFVPVESIKIQQKEWTLFMGRKYDLSVTVLPTNASLKDVEWYSSDLCIATIDANTGVITPRHPGTTRILAIAKDGSGKRDFCDFKISDYSPIIVHPRKVHMRMNETTTVSRGVSPSVLQNDSMRWKSSDNRVATVDENGIVTALSDGVTTITAELVKYGYSDSCIVTVDSRPTVNITKDGDYFNVSFENGPTWKSIGCDMALPENSSGEEIWYPGAYEFLLEHERRYLFNTEQYFSIDQIAFLYLLDPLGIEYYVKYGMLNFDKSLSERLMFKDELYEKIFGNTEREKGQFYFKIVDNRPVYGRYNGEDRVNVFSNAEVLFGSHVIWDFEQLILGVLDAIFSCVSSKYSSLKLGVELFQALFFSGSFSGTCSNAAELFLDKYIGEDGKDLLVNLIDWPTGIFGTIQNIVDVFKDSITVMNTGDIQIYKTVNNQNYRVQFDDGSKQLSMQEIIGLCKSE